MVEDINHHLDSVPGKAYNLLIKVKYAGVQLSILVFTFISLARKGFKYFSPIFFFPSDFILSNVGLCHDNLYRRGWRPHTENK